MKDRLLNSISGTASRRRMLQASAMSACGAGMLSALGTSPIAAADKPANLPFKSVIYIFLSGGLGQQDSFDPKPNAPAEIRGEFNPIATQTPGLQICEHLPMLAARSKKWSLVRSLTHPYNEHSQGHMVMLSGQTPLPTGFNPSKPNPTDHPSIAALMGSILPERDALPSSVVLPEKLIHRTGRVIPGQFAGLMGSQRDPWILAASRFNARTYGAWPEYEFHHQRGAEQTDDLNYRTPGLSLPENVTRSHFSNRLELLHEFEQRMAELGSTRELEPYGRYRERAISMLGNGELNRMFDIQGADPKVLERYGNNTFGWSLLLSRRLVEAGVGFVQVNLGNNETWDTHGNAFPHLKNYLMPPTDRAVSALLDDLDERGLLDDTLVVMAGEFGRTPKVFGISAYKLPGRDHWGAVQTVFFAGGGVRGGTVVGSSDSQGGHPDSDPQSAESMAATMYHALGLPRDTHWYDLQNRPLPIYNGEPIRKLMTG